MGGEIPLKKKMFKLVVISMLVMLMSLLIDSRRNENYRSRPVGPFHQQQPLPKTRNSPIPQMIPSQPYRFGIENDMKEMDFYLSPSNGHNIITVKNESMSNSCTDREFPCRTMIWLQYNLMDSMMNVIHLMDSIDEEGDNMEYCNMVFPVRNLAIIGDADMTKWKCSTSFLIESRMNRQLVYFENVELTGQLSIHSDVVAFQSSMLYRTTFTQLNARYVFCGVF